MNKTGWIAVGAASALGLGVVASAALTAANAMPLTDVSTATSVPPISTAVADTKAFAGNGDVRFWVASSTPVVSVTPTPTPATTMTPTPASPPAPVQTAQPAPAPVPAPVGPLPGGDSPSAPDSGSVSAAGSSD